MEPAVERGAVEVEDDVTEAVCAQPGEARDEGLLLGHGELSIELAPILSQQRGKPLAQAPRRDLRRASAFSRW